jgi:glycosyltransferase involved in cell wall biosynthesis
MKEQERKRVLILTYYWPPSGGAGVQRWLKFTKYMRKFGYEPVIYTAEDPEYPSIDESLYQDIPENITVLRTPVWEPYKLYKWFTLQKKGHRVNTGFLNRNKKKGLAEKISVWVRGNLFIPDARRFWIKPSARYLLKYLEENPADIMVSTGPPHSLHMIALKISEKTNLPWVADFRDPWTKIDFYKDLMLGRRADRMHRLMERSVLGSASAVTVISGEMKQQFEEMGCRNIRLIPNGFDPDDFDPKPETGAGRPDVQHAASMQLDPEFSLTHIGSIVPSRNPSTLWKVLSGLVGENEEFARDLKISLVGAVDYSAGESIRESALEQWVEYTDYLPHREAAEVLKKSQVLLLLINDTPNARGILTGKFFEYLCSGRPILAIGPPDGEVAHVLRETGTGEIVDFGDRESLKELILEFYAKYREGNLVVKAANTEKYSRKNLTGKMTELFNEITSAK